MWWLRFSWTINNSHKKNSWESVGSGSDEHCIINESLSQIIDDPAWMVLLLMVATTLRKPDCAGSKNMFIIAIFRVYLSLGPLALFTIWSISLWDVTQIMWFIMMLIIQVNRQSNPYQTAFAGSWWEILTRN